MSLRDTVALAVIMPSPSQPSHSTAPSPAAARPAGGLGDVARRMRSRTLDLIAIGIVLVAGLTFGRQIVEWWRTEPVDLAAGVPALGVNSGWGDGGAPVTLEFGDRPFVLARQMAPGDRDSTLATLRDRCRAVLEKAALPATEPDAAEKSLLKRTAALKPVAEEAGAWQVYLLEGPFALVVGIRIGGAERMRDAAATSEPPPAPRRVVCWGLALPLSERAWTLYIFTAGQPAAADPAALPHVPVPHGARQVLALREERGGELIGFSGNGAPEEWSRFYDEWFASHGWYSADGWQTVGGSWTARFVPQGETGAARFVADVQFGTDSGGSLMGLVNLFSF